MVIFTVSGSLREGSSNTSILQTIKSVAPAGHEFILFENLGGLPHYNSDLDTDNPPAEIKELRGMLKRSDALIISTPEYAHGIPGSLKNALDWLVSTTLLENKPVSIIVGSASEGSYARDNLMEVLKTMNAKVNPELNLNIAGSQAKSEDPKVWQELKGLVENLVLSTRPKS